MLNLVSLQTSIRSGDVMLSFVTKLSCHPLFCLLILDAVFDSQIFNPPLDLDSSISAKCF